jgi:hypothetical protein
LFNAVGDACHACDYNAADERFRGMAAAIDKHLATEGLELARVKYEVCTFSIVAFMFFHGDRDSYADREESN